MLFTSSSLLESSLKLLGLLIAFILIVIACWLVTRFVGTRQLGRMKNSNFKVIDVYRISQNQSLQIVQIGKRYFVLAVSKDTVTSVTELGEDEFTVPGQTGSDVKQFGQILSALTKKKDATENKKVDIHEEE